MASSISRITYIQTFMKGAPFFAHSCRKTSPLPWNFLYASYTTCPAIFEGASVEKPRMVRYEFDTAVGVGPALPPTVRAPVAVKQPEVSCVLVPPTLQVEV